MKGTMITPVNEIAILVSAILALAIASIWYSPLLFRNYWMRVIGLTEDDLEDSKKRMPMMVALALVANVVIFYVVAQFVAFQGTSLSISSFVTLGAALSILYGALISNAVIWEGRTLAYLLIHLGYAVVTLFIGLVVIAYWPW
jgi:hypothetical protein